MQKAPKSLHLQIGLFGRTNVGKSTFLNYITSQDVSITSPVPGTTTDIVEKAMELLPLGPVLFFDTGGIDDISELSQLRIQKTKKILERCDIIILVIESNIWGEYERYIAEQTDILKKQVIVIANKAGSMPYTDKFLSDIRKHIGAVVVSESLDLGQRDKTIWEFKRALMKLCPEDFLRSPALIGDLMPKNGMTLLIVPIDLEAPKGRIILPQVQTIRDLLDHNQSALVIKENQYPDILKRLVSPPDLVVCDSKRFYLCFG